MGNDQSQGIRDEESTRSALANSFMEALQNFERERDVETFLPMFAPDVVLIRAPRSGSYDGQEGARKFWSEYLEAFASVSTVFRRVTESAERVVLEWHSVASTKLGRPVEYDGCSIFESAGTQVVRFWTYYDASAAGMGIGVQQ